jgi:hypothetical protein
MEQYPAVRFMVNHGRWLAILIGVSLPVLVFAGVIVADWSWVWGALSLAVGLMAGFAFRTFAELTQIITDMLLPQ